MVLVCDLRVLDFCFVLMFVMFMLFVLVFKRLVVFVVDSV